jgi:hypothetical protein
VISFSICTFQNLFNGLKKAQIGHHLLFTLLSQRFKTLQDSNFSPKMRKNTWECWNSFSHTTHMKRERITNTNKMPFIANGNGTTTPIVWCCQFAHMLGFMEL